MDSSNSTRPDISSQHLGPAVSIVTFILLVTSTLALIARLSTKWAVSHRVNLDDLLLGIALIFSIGNGISTFYEASNGLGSPTTSSSGAQLLVAQKASYAAELFYIASLCFTKLSAVAFLYMLTPISSNEILCISYGIFTIVWTLTTFASSALQCSAPKVWLIFGNKCFNQQAFWTTYLVIEMILNFLLVVYPIYMLWNLHVRRAQKIAVWCCFAFRVFVVAALIVQLALYRHAYESSDFLFKSWGAVTASEIVLCLSYVAPCLPYLRPFLESLDSGMLRNDGIRRLGHGEAESKASGSKGSGSSYGLQPVSNSAEKKSPPSTTVGLGPEVATLWTEGWQVRGQH
ncbi:uncharacterized protein LY89DRAFT_688749 [Mollisia scopiformis]|uniref:Rhodopsin domain-containing protein n=1 Tax=Mollisia scopiformis TaxID=149040 RepID=A0A194WU80_MOLSC|nr:uncharacterized protein LY89DRAFT_688749 [Mollisia scopiformis]KUJ11513.1 hypothetical protein LY89DRAFT_688749 [Mollisia scopiformis]